MDGGAKIAEDLAALPLRMTGFTQKSISSHVPVGMFTRAVVDQMSSKPGVIAVAISNAVAASDVSPQSAFTVEGVSADHWKLKFAAFTSVYGNYFCAMGIPLLDVRPSTLHAYSNPPLL